MINSKFLALIVLSIALAFAMGGCSGPVSSGDINDTSFDGFENPIDPDSEILAREAGIDFPDHCGDYVIKPLYAGQTIHVGWVAVWNDEDTLYLHYRTSFGWMMSETHAAIADSLGGIPHTKKGNPKVGNFPLKGDHDPMETDVQYEIPYDDWDAGTELFVAMHAVVNHVDGEGNINQEETAWGDGCYPCGEIKGGNWATFFTFEVQDCP